MTIKPSKSAFFSAFILACLFGSASAVGFIVLHQNQELADRYQQIQALSHESELLLEKVNSLNRQRSDQLATVRQELSDVKDELTTTQNALKTAKTEISQLNAKLAPIEAVFQLKNNRIHSTEIVSTDVAAHVQQLARDREILAACVADIFEPTDQPGIGTVFNLGTSISEREGNCHLSRHLVERLVE